ncbi:MAG: macro domain-containing protein [Saprospiraceae bacterium]
MIRYLTGNLLDAQAQALVNTVNTVGVMGKGIALQFKEAFPHNYKLYVAACKKGELMPGKLLVVREPTMQGEKIIVNFPTKTEWFKKSQYEYIKIGLQELINVIHREKMSSIAIPPLGCGNGGLKWERVRPMIENHLGGLEGIDVQVFEPSDAVKAILKAQELNKPARLTPARAMLLYSMFYYESSGEPASLFVANKLAYLLQRLGENLRLSFTPSHYGPYSVQIEHVLHNLNGTYLRGLEQRNAKAFEPLELNYAALEEVKNYVASQLSPEQRQRLDNLLSLVEGFQSALSLEILATVDFVKKGSPNMTEPEIAEVIYNWSDRKRKLFQEKYIHIAFQHLQGYSQQLNF